MSGSKESTRINNVTVALKQVGVIVGGAFYVHRADWTPFIPKDTGTFGSFGWSGIPRGSSEPPGRTWWCGSRSGW